MSLGTHEAAFWAQMRKGLGRIEPLGRPILLDRIESPGTGCGIPDVYMVDPEYGPCWIELKIADHQKIKISALQSSWLRTRAAYGVRIRIIAKVAQKDRSLIRIWSGTEAEIVRQRGLAVPGVVGDIPIGRDGTWQAVRSAIYLLRN